MSQFTNCLLRDGAGQRLFSSNSSVRTTLIKINLIDEPLSSFAQTRITRMHVDGADGGLQVCDEQSSLEGGVHVYSSPRKSYLYTPFEKGLLLMPDDLIAELGFAVHTFDLHTSDSCLGDVAQRFFVRNVLGYDAIVLNWSMDIGRRFNRYVELHSADRVPGHRSSLGFIRSARSKEITELNPRYAYKNTGSHFDTLAAIGQRLVLLATVLFIFFLSTTLVSFVLRETQARMLRFTFVLDYRIRHGVPYTQLVISHVVEIFIFIPLMVGILFFLNGFYSGDRLLAFMSLTVVWGAEVFSVICARTLITAKFFPSVFLLYYVLYHLYVFVFPFGFCHFALFTLSLLLWNSMYFFWHKYELPALYLGNISPRAPRMIAGDAAGPSPDVLGVGNEFSTSSVVLEDEIELSRRIQQQQMVDLFLSSEVENRQMHEERRRRFTESDATPRRRHSSGGNTRNSAALSPVSPSSRSADASPLHHRPRRSSATAANGSPFRRHPQGLALSSDSDMLGALQWEMGRRSESTQNLLDFASCN